MTLTRLSFAFAVFRCNNNSYKIQNADRRLRDHMPSMVETLSFCSDIIIIDIVSLMPYYFRDVIGYNSY